MKLILCFFICLNALGFTLNPNSNRGFNKTRIKVHISSDSCGERFTRDEFINLTKDAVEDYWNKIPSSSLKLKVATDQNIGVGELSYEEIFEKGLIPNHSILAGCSSKAFDDEPNILGGTVMSCKGKNCRSVFLINITPGSRFAEISNRERTAVIAHELGHALA